MRLLKPMLSRLRMVAVATVAGAAAFNCHAEQATTASQPTATQPTAASAQAPARSGGKGIGQVGVAPQVKDVASVGSGGADSQPATGAQSAASGGESSARPAPSGTQQAQQAAAGASADQGGRTQQSESAGGPLPSPRVDFVQTAVDAVAPMDPGQIRDFKKKLDERQGAEVSPVRSDLIPVSVTYDIDLSPGAKPQVVQITPGQGALINIIDREGNGWPVKKVKNYNEGAFKVEEMGESTLSVEALSNHQLASIGVLLEGMSVAWSFTVIPAQVTTDVRVDLRLPSLSPGAVSKVGRASGLPSVGAKLDGYLYGGTPEGARRLEVQGVAGARAWQSPDGRLVLRIAGLVSSPAWYDRMPAADGTAVYELPATPVVAVATDDGTSHTIRIKGLQPMVSAAEKGALGVRQ